MFASGTIIYVPTVFQLCVSDLFFTLMRFGARAEASVQPASTLAGNRKFFARGARSRFCSADFVDFSRLFHRVLSIEFFARRSSQPLGFHQNGVSDNFFTWAADCFSSYRHKFHHNTMLRVSFSFLNSGGTHSGSAFCSRVSKSSLKCQTTEPTPEAPPLYQIVTTRICMYY